MKTHLILKIFLFVVVTVNALNAEILPLGIRTKLAQKYQSFTKSTTLSKILDPIPATEKWRFSKDGVVLLSSDESFKIVAVIHSNLKMPKLTQGQFNNLMASDAFKQDISTKIVSSNRVMKALIAFFSQVGAESFRSNLNDKNNWQFVVNYVVPLATKKAPVTPPAQTPVLKTPTIKVPEPITAPAIDNKSPALLKALATLAKQDYASWLKQPWRFDEPGVIKMNSNDSFALMATATKGQPLTQAAFNSFMSALSTGGPLKPPHTTLRNNLNNLLKDIPINRITSHFVNKNWQLRFSLASSSPSAVTMPVPKQAPAPATTIDDSSWLRDAIAKNAHYYLKAYDDAPYEYIEKTVQGKSIRVNRPDHALAHAIRKTALATDLLNLVAQNQKPEYLYQAINQLRIDVQNFDKLFQLSAFLLRAGRQSESPSKEQYQDYIFNSASYVAAEAAKFGQLFRQDDIADFVKAIKATASGDLEKALNDKQRWISQLLNAVHDFDLLRITSFEGGKKLEVDRLKKSLAQDLATVPADPLIDTLLDKSGKYLDATGDINVTKGNLTRTDDFFIQSQQPSLIIEAIKKAGGFPNLK